MFIIFRECFSVLFEKICEGVLKVMFIGVSMLSSKMLLNPMLLISIAIFQLKIYQDGIKLFRKLTFYELRDLTTFYELRAINIRIIMLLIKAPRLG